jgi:signal transduction histidine kinase
MPGVTEGDAVKNSSWQRRINNSLFLLRWAIPLCAVAAFIALPSSNGQIDFTPSEMAVSLVLILLTFASNILAQRAQRRRPATVDEREIEAERLRAARERTQIIYTMAATLNNTLSYEKVLNAALDVGVMGLRKLGQDTRLTSAVMLFQGRELRIAAARGFTQQDSRVTLPAQRGILSIAVNQAEPVFGGAARSDPELQYLSGMANVRSMLVIPLRAGFDKYGVLVFGSEQPDAFSDDHIELLNAISTQATIALQNATLYLKLRQEKDKLVAVEEDARKKLARDLHDGPVQIVSAVAMRANLVRNMLTRKPEIIPDELAKIEDLARQATKEIRHTLFTLRPLVLETQGLGPALQQMAVKMKETYDLNVIAEPQAGVDALLNINQQSVLFYIAEEAINNARKHAESQHIWVRLSRQREFAILEIQDDGKGFDVQAVETGYEKRGSLGMINMRERAEMAEGSVKLESAKGKGTRITVVIPLKPLEAESSNPLEDTAARKSALQPGGEPAQKPKQASVMRSLRSPSDPTS